MISKFKVAVAGTLLGLVALAAGCDSPADVASTNLSTAADRFEIQRRIVFINTRSEKYLLLIEGRCSLGNSDKAGELSVTCKVSDKDGGQFVKHFLGLSESVTYVVEQTEVASVSTYNYKLVFRPETIITDIDLDVQNPNGDK